ncbi:Ubiquitin carboxyl-terminal hydrolase [Nesidiocoris tenuis]|uniref:ubiquitinyl hydrolase 1 n=1 Tax=Nesidiocoris tenuis TaxID=355587 RepID=A0ABN7B1R8_9HEMI|nr:Ubiquitin carboxyl-terminal hydrolase [Nesidiocoris tenuis]
MDKDNILLFGLSACALGLSLFILWGPKLGRKSNSVRSLVALQNLGLTCFLNSLLQALASCPSFFEWLEARRSNGPVSESLYNVLKVLCFERDPDVVGEVYSPDVLVRHLRDKSWPSFPLEQDSHELFLHILSRLEEEESKAMPKRVESLYDIFWTQEERLNANRVTSHGDVPAFMHLANTKIEIPVLTPSPFRGYLASQLSCCNCGHKSAVVYDQFDTLTLPLPSKGISFRLQRLLGDFVSAELVDGISCDHCNKNREPSDPPVLTKASKAITIGKLPKCLSLHISRTYMSNDGHMYKRDNYVDFPEYLNMSCYTHNSSMLKDRKLQSKEADIPKVSQPAEPVVPADIHAQHNGISGGKDSPDSVRNSEEEFATPTSSAESPVPPSVLNSNNNTVQTAEMLAMAANNFLSGPIYRLKAVVEHRGTSQSGHFVTYRRGPLQTDIRHRSTDLLDQSESRWFFTSDEVVTRSSLCEAFQSSAYLLFYEKCLNDPLPPAQVQ